MDHECPDPLVPDEVDLTDFKFMPLEVSRLLQSEWWLVAGAEDPRRAYAAVNLWARSWHQRPAASLPDNEVVLSKMADVPLTVWREIRDVVLAPWVKCSDGRWYHPVVAEKALEAWETKRSYAKRTEDFTEVQRARAKKGWEKRRMKATADAGAMPGQSPDNANESNSNSKRDSKGKGDSHFVPNQSANALFPTAGAAGARAKAPKGEGYTREFEEWWKLFPRKDGKGAAFRAFKTALKLVPVETLMAGVRDYAARKKDDPAFIKHAATWLNGHCWNDEEPPKPARKYPPGYVPMAANGG